MASVAELKSLLVKTGFLRIDENGGTEIDWPFQRAIQEFQRYASLRWAAQQILPPPSVELFAISSAFQSFPLGANHRYKGKINGTYTDADTQAALQAWAADGLHCPVITQIYYRLKNAKSHVLRPKPNLYNFWDKLPVPSKNQAATEQWMVAAWDFSQHFVSGEPILGPIIIGKLGPVKVPKQVKTSKIYSNYGAVSDHPPTTNPCTPAYPIHWPGAAVIPSPPGANTEILPESLTGKAFEELSPADKSLFRIFRSVSEVECFGYFDSINAYDRAIMSVGICHWTLSSDNSTSKGELGGLLSYFAKIAPLEEANKLLGAFGLGVDKAWDTDSNSPDGGALLDSLLGTYASKLTTGYTQEIDEFRGWHWAYRFSTALRTLPSLRLAMWHLTKLRLQNLLAREFRAEAGVGNVQEGAGSRPARYADVFQSEQAVALLLRWHVNQPAVAMDRASAPRNPQRRKESRKPLNWMRQLLDVAVPPLVRKQPPKDWAPTAQAALASAVQHASSPYSPGGFSTTLDHVATWPSYKGRDPAYKADQPFSIRLQARGDLTFSSPSQQTPTPVLEDKLENGDWLSWGKKSLAWLTDGVAALIGLKGQEDTTKAVNVVSLNPSGVTQSPAAPFTAPDWLVVRGYTDDEQEAFRVVSRQEVGAGQYALVLLQGGEVVPRLQYIEQVTRLELGQTDDVMATPLWEIAMPRQYVQQMDISAGKLQFNFAVRAFVVPGLSQLRFNGTIAFLDAATGKLGFTRLEVSDIGAQLGANVLPFERLADLQLEGRQAGRMAFAKAIAISGKSGVGERHKVTISLPLTGVQNGSRSHCLTIRTDLVLASPLPQLNYLPFGLQGNYNDVDNGGDGFRDFLSFWQRQPSVDPLRVAQAQQWLVEVEVPSRTVLRRWQASLEDFFRAIRMVEAGRNLSFLPALELADELDGLPPLPQLLPQWRATYLLQDLPGPDGTASDNTFDVQPVGGGTAGHVAVFARQLTPVHARTTQLWNGVIAFPALRHADWQEAPILNQPLSKGWYSHSAQVGAYSAASDQAILETELLRPDESFWIGFRYDEFISSPALLGSQVRLQGLSLWLPKSASLSSQPATKGNRVRLQLRTVDHVPIGLALDLRLTALRFGPGGQDDLPGEEFEIGPDLGGTAVRRPPAILIALNKQVSRDVAAESGRYVLNARESYSVDSNHDLTLRLAQLQAQRNAIDLLVLDPEPMAVIRVVSADLGGDQAEGAEIANWAYRPGDGAYGWQVRLHGSSFQLLLPPQAIGEAMHRSREALDIDAEHPIDARFGRPAEVQLLPSEFGGEFVELPWNLRRRLGYPGQHSPGARLSSITVELLYGMPSTITHPDLRLTEMQARLGTAPAYLPISLPWTIVSNPQLERYDGYRESWRQIRDALRARPAVWEPYNPALEIPGQPLTGQRLTLRAPQELRVELDPTADLAYPVAGMSPPAGSLIPHSPEGLKGSFAWAFESANIYSLLWREQIATEAELTGLQLSSLGGSGQLKASFAGGNIVITAAVTLGRVDSLQVEVRGRISHFWNRARYVVVYERSVAGTRQFMLEQYGLVGWPVLRKTQEYVEIDQPERRMVEPDGTDDQRRAAGLVVGCLFPAAGGQAPRIRVNGRWGQDVGETGWRLPLWVRGAAPADVYPMPDVRMLAAGDQAGTTTACPIEDPEKLFFFALTAGIPRPPDDWGAIAGVDYIALPAEALVVEQDTSAAPHLAVVPGLGAYTFTLGASRPLNLVQGRQQEGIVTRLRTITVMRGPIVTQAEGEGNLALQNAYAAADSVLSILLPTRQIIDGSTQSSLSAAHTKSIVDAKYEAITAAIGQAATELGNRAKITINELAKKPDELLKLQQEEMRTRLTRAYQSERNALQQAIISQLGAFAYQASLLARELLPLPEPAPAPGTATALSIEAKAQLKTLFANLASLPANEAEKNLTYGLQGQLAHLRGTPGESQLLAANATDEQDEIIEATIDNLGAAVEEALLLWQAWLLLDATDHERARIQQDVAARLMQLANEVQQAADRLLTSVAEVSRRWLGHQPSTIQLKTAESYNKLRTALLALRIIQLPEQATEVDVKNAIEALNNANKRIAVAWTDSASEAVAFADQVRKFSRASWDELGKIAANSFDGLVFEWLNQVNLVVDDAGTSVENLPQKLIDAISALIEHLLQDQGSELFSALNELQQGVEEELKAVFDALVPGIVQLKEYYDQGTAYLTEVKEELEKLQESSERVLLTYLDSVSSNVRTLAGDLVAYTEAALFKQLPSLGSIGQGPVAQAALTLLRAFGQPPRVPGLDFNDQLMQGVAYSFIKKEKDTLQAAANVAFTQLKLQAGDASRHLAQEAMAMLTPINISFNTRELAERFLPNLDNLSLGDLLPNLAGLPLKELLGNIPIPPEARDNVKVRQEYDQQSRTRRVYVDLVLRLPDSVPLLNVAGISLRLLPGTTLTANIQIDVPESNPAQPRTRARGQISGNWELLVGSLSLAQLVDTTLRFDENGHLQFEITPDRIRLQQILDFVTKAMPTLGVADSGLSVQVTPTGANTTLNLPLPNIQAGTFGLANLYLSFLFGLELQNGFELMAGLGVGRRSAPFTLTVFVLGGAGWVEAAVRYNISKRQMSAQVSIALFASAGIGISLGPISGGIYAYFGVTAEFRSGESLTLGIMLLFTGSVSLLGLVRVSLTLMLQAEYGNGQLVGRGYVEYKIKIGWLISIKVKAGVAYAFGNSKGNSAKKSPNLAASRVEKAPLAGATPYELADAYLKMFDFTA